MYKPPEHNRASGSIKMSQGKGYEIQLEEEETVKHTDPEEDERQPVSDAVRIKDTSGK